MKAGKNAYGGSTSHLSTSHPTSSDRNLAGTTAAAAAATASSHKSDPNLRTLDPKADNHLSTRTTGSHPSSTAGTKSSTLRNDESSIDATHIGKDRAAISNVDAGAKAPSSTAAHAPVYTDTDKNHTTTSNSYVGTAEAALTSAGAAVAGILGYGSSNEKLTKDHSSDANAAGRAKTTGELGKESASQTSGNATRTTSEPSHFSGGLSHSEPLTREKHVSSASHPAGSTSAIRTTSSSDHASSADKTYVEKDHPRSTADENASSTKLDQSSLGIGGILGNAAAAVGLGSSNKTSTERTSGSDDSDISAADRKKASEDRATAHNKKHGITDDRSLIEIAEDDDPSIKKLDAHKGPSVLDNADNDPNGRHRTLV